MRFAIILGVFLLLWFLFRFFMQPAPALQQRDSVSIEIPYGTSSYGIVQILADSQLVRNRMLADLTIALLQKIINRPIHAGKYTFSRGQSQFQVLVRLFLPPELSLVKVTIPEGMTMWEIASLLQDALKLDSARLMELMTSDSVCKAWGIPASTLEGYLYPDTYFVPEKITEERIITLLLREHFRVWEECCDSLARIRRMTHHEAVTLASIIEAEARLPSERRRISGVFHNRLRHGLPLQADPTVQYALGVRKRLLYKDLEMNHPYNTYKVQGLPPGPINSPGRESLRAAVDPEEHNYFYFVVAPDGSGAHVFSPTYAEHRKAVREYRIYRMNQKGENR